ncbi:Replication-associated recombination protein A [Entomobacter blattae]|uniref:Replication-associated recombination protein A n=1 Tax=Entomobacter blattae TaxID=2762277 RepID=A0A7H1NT66_9PROT|nr:replication-associated recombination protein A [Entomobacter blattae]QNT78976.1 Replication-associated recombination protein A [Entomobacter blattae]
MDNDDLFGSQPSDAKAESNDTPKVNPRASQSEDSGRYRPLADLLRPNHMADIIGQEHLTGEGGALSGMFKSQQFSSLILWGPPGVGKTTIARLLAHKANRPFEQISAVFSGVADLKKVFEKARLYRQQNGVSTILFVDEIHRFNRAQQDGFLSVVEDGTVILVGATTENPSFSLNGALLSRCQVFVLHRLDEKSLLQLLSRAEEKIHRQLPLTEQARRNLVYMAGGDGRYLLNMAEYLFSLSDYGPDHQNSENFQQIHPEDLGKILSHRAIAYDRDREEHYNLISALHKSVRGSDPDAALYWFARMLEGGEDPRFLSRRLTRMAVEDIGLADPHALNQAMAASAAYEQLGSPEGELALAQLVVYLATAPKSNALYTAYKMVRKNASATGSLMPPAHILNAPTTLMKDIGYGEGYRYDHDEPDAFSGQNYFPDEMTRKIYYHPTPRGYEATLAKRLQHWSALRKSRNNPQR